MSERSSLLSVALRMVLVLGGVVWLVTSKTFDDSEQRVKQQAESFGLDGTGQVWSLSISSEPFDADLLPGLDGLRKLTISDRIVDRMMVERIIRTDIRELCLHDCEVLPEAVPVLVSGLGELNRLALHGCRGGDDVVDLLKIRCRLLDLTNCDWVNDALLAECKWLRAEVTSLNLQATGITDQLGPVLAECTALSELNVSDCDVSSTSFLSDLRGVRTLRNVDVCGCPLSLKDLRAFHDSRPEVAVSFLPEIYPELSAVTQLGSESGRKVRLFASCFENVVVRDDGGRCDGLRWMPATSSIVFRGSETDDERVSFLEHMPQVTSLDCSETDITDASLQRFSGLRNLKKLLLSSTAVTDEGSRSLGKLLLLEDVDVSDTSITDDGVESWYKLAALKTVNLSGTKIGSRGLSVLASLPSLLYIEWSGLCVSEIEEPLLRRLEKLTDTWHINSCSQLKDVLQPGLPFTTVHIADRTIGRDELSQLGAWPNLTLLWFTRCNFRPRELDFTKIATARSLYFDECDLTEEDLQSLKLPIQLSSLDFGGMPVPELTDSVATLRQISNLTLWRSQLSMKTLHHMLHPGLKSLNLRQCRLSDSGQSATLSWASMPAAGLWLSLEAEVLGTLLQSNALTSVRSLVLFEDEPADFPEVTLKNLLDLHQLNSVEVHASEETCLRLQRLADSSGYTGTLQCVPLPPRVQSSD